MLQAGLRGRIAEDDRSCSVVEIFREHFYTHYFAVSLDIFRPCVVAGLYELLSSDFMTFSISRLASMPVIYVFLGIGVDAGYKVYPFMFFLQLGKGDGG